MKEKTTTRVYRGCTTFGCEYGFDEQETVFTDEQVVCPGCGGDLTEITRTRIEWPA